jgi:hypothetical protein
VSCPTIGGKFPFEAFDLGSADEDRGVKGISERLQKLSLELLVWCYEIEERNGR